VWFLLKTSLEGISICPVLHLKWCKVQPCPFCSCTYSMCTWRSCVLQVAVWLQLILGCDSPGCWVILCDHHVSCCTACVVTSSFAAVRRQFVLTSAVEAAAADAWSLYHLDGVNPGNVMLVLCTSTSSNIIITRG